MFRYYSLGRILFSFESDDTGRVKAPQQIFQASVSGRALTPAVILFIALPDTQDNDEPG